MSNQEMPPTCSAPAGGSHISTRTRGQKQRRVIDPKLTDTEDDGDSDKNENSYNNDSDSESETHSLFGQGGENEVDGDDLESQIHPFFDYDGSDEDEGEDSDIDT
jgi:hypothetical protein